MIINFFNDRNLNEKDTILYFKRIMSDNEEETQSVFNHNWQIKSSWFGDSNDDALADKPFVILKY